MRRHSNNVGTDGARFGATDTLERINTQVSPDAAKGIEHQGIKRGGTRTCPRRKAGQAPGSTPVRGNTDEGIGETKIKTQVGQDRNSAGLAALGGQDPNTMSAVSRWQRTAAGTAVKLP
jgi:hypothetical protein